MSVDIASGLTAISSAKSLLRELKDHASKRRGAELHAKVNEFWSEHLTLVQAFGDLRREYEELRGQLNAIEPMEWEHNVYWREEAGKRVPFCPQCRDGKRRAVRIGDEGRHWRCTVCYDTQDKPEEMERLARDRALFGEP